MLGTSDTGYVYDFNVYTGKMFILILTETGYLHNFNVYTGASEEEAEYGLCSQAVMDLVAPLAGRGHIVYTDNYYTSPVLIISVDARARDLRMWYLQAWSNWVPKAACPQVPHK